MYGLFGWVHLGMVRRCLTTKNSYGAGALHARCARGATSPTKFHSLPFVIRWDLPQLVCVDLSLAPPPTTTTTAAAAAATATTTTAIPNCRRDRRAVECTFFSGPLQEFPLFSICKGLNLAGLPQITRHSSGLCATVAAQGMCLTSAGNRAQSPLIMNYNHFHTFHSFGR